MNQAVALLTRAKQYGMLTIGAFFVRLRAVVHGQGLVEYALILLLVAVAAIGAMSLFGGQVSSMYSEIDCGIKTATGGSPPPGCP